MGATGPRSRAGRARCGWPADLADTALLLTSELVTNAVNACHSSGCASPLTIFAEWAEPGSLCVLVHDDAPGLPVQRDAAGDAKDGRGLLLINACTAEWGVCRHGPGRGKAVWFELGGPTDAEG